MNRQEARYVVSDPVQANSGLRQLDERNTMNIHNPVAYSQAA